MLAKNCKGEQGWSTAARRPHGDTLHVHSRGENKLQKIPRDPPGRDPSPTGSVRGQATWRPAQIFELGSGESEKWCFAHEVARRARSPGFCRAVKGDYGSFPLRDDPSGAVPGSAPQPSSIPGTHRFPRERGFSSLHPPRRETASRTRVYTHTHGTVLTPVTACE